MSAKDTGGSAFPATNYVIPADLEARHVAALGRTQGMTKREVFAMAALQGILGNAYWNEHGPYTPTDVAQAAREYADALLAELNAEES